MIDEHQLRDLGLDPRPSSSRAGEVGFGLGLVVRVRSWVWVHRASVAIVATLLAVIPLVSVLTYVAARGIAQLDWSFLTELPKPVGETGGGVAQRLRGGTSPKAPAPSWSDRRAAR